MVMPLVHSWPYLAASKGWYQHFSPYRVTYRNQMALWISLELSEYLVSLLRYCLPTFKAKDLSQACPSLMWPPSPRPQPCPFPVSTTGHPPHRGYRVCGNPASKRFNSSLTLPVPPFLTRHGSPAHGFSPHVPWSGGLDPRPHSTQPALSGESSKLRM